MASYFCTTTPFPHISLFAKLQKGHKIIIEKHENYQKKGLRNRYYVLQESKVLCLTIPLETGKNNRCPITEVQIFEDEDWRNNHFRSIQTCYGKSPYYEHYIDTVYNILFFPTKNLWDFNVNSLVQLKKICAIKNNFEFSQEYSKDVQGIDQRSYKSNMLGISLNKLRYYDYYEFVNPLENVPLSIIDTIFHRGPETKRVLNDLKLEDEDHTRRI
jgi:hypothetical protein